MSNAAKIAARIKPKKAIVRTRKVKVDLTKQAPAIIDGKLVLPVKAKVFFERTQYGKSAIHEGHIFSIDSSDSITVFDETLGQFAVVSLGDPTKIRSTETASILQEGSQRVKVDEEGLVGCNSSEGGNSNESSASVEGSSS